MSALLPLAACLLLMWAGSCSAHSLFTCEPIRVHRCLGMSYNMTFFPNMMEHYDQDIAADLMEVRTCSGSACCWLQFRRVLYLYLCTYIYLIFLFFFEQGGTAVSTVANHSKGCFYVKFTRDWTFAQWKDVFALVLVGNSLVIVQLNTGHSTQNSGMRPLSSRAPIGSLKLSLPGSVCSKM